MHQGVLAARDETARMRIAAAVAKIAHRLGVTLDPTVMAAVQGRDRYERAMKHNEVVAGALEYLLLRWPAEAAPEPEKRSRRSKGDGVPG